MRRVLILLVLTYPVWGQTPVVRVVSEEAEQHLLRRVPPVYPPLAQQTGITGVVILEVRIDESGTPSVRRAIHGHPLLEQAAIDAVRGWKYKPFEIDGKTVGVTTLVMVPFASTRPQEDEGRNEMLFHHNFWTAEDSAEVSLMKGDETGATQELSRASALLAPVSNGQQHLTERARWMTDMGELCATQRKNGDAEDYYKKALKFNEEIDRDSPDTASAQAHLAQLYAGDKKYDLAREFASKSLKVYKKSFKIIGSRDATAERAYGSAIARLSWMLSEIASEQNNHSEAVKQCRTVLDFQAFLDQAEQNSFTPACQKMFSEPAPKN